jgi:hypothetical protein
MGTLLLLESPFILGLLACGWAFVANHRTYRDLTWLASRIFALPTDRYQVPLKMYEAVDYDKHFWQIFWLRDPWDLYDQTVFRLVNALPKGHVPQISAREPA